MQAFIKKYKAEIIIVLGGIISILTSLVPLTTGAKATLIITFVTAAITVAYNWLKDANSTATATELANLVQMLPDVMNLIINSLKQKKSTETTETTTTTDTATVAAAMDELQKITGLTKEEIIQELLKGTK